MLETELLPTDPVYHNIYTLKANWGVFETIKILARMCGGEMQVSFERCMECLKGYSRGEDKRVILSYDGFLSMTFQEQIYVQKKWKNLVFGGFIFHRDHSKKDIGESIINGYWSLHT